MNQIPNRAFFDAFVAPNPFDLTHWHDGEIYGNGESWYAKVVLWGGSKVYDPFALWHDFTGADDSVERAFEVTIGPDEIRKALEYIHRAAGTEPGRQRRLYMSQKAAYEAGRWFEGHWQGHDVNQKVADEILQVAAMLAAGEWNAYVLF